MRFENISGALQHAFVSFPYNYDTLYDFYKIFEIDISILKIHMKRITFEFGEILRQIS